MRLDSALLAVLKLTDTHTCLLTWHANVGAVVRLHSALLAVLTHLVGKLKGVALRNSQVRVRLGLCK